MHISFVYLLDSVWREYIYIYLGPRITIFFQSVGRSCVITGKTGHFSAYWRNDEIFRSKLKFGDNDPSWRGAGM